MRLRDPALLATKASERCGATKQPGMMRTYRCHLKKGHTTAHYFRYQAGVYQMTYEYVEGNGPSPLLDEEYEEVPCEACGGTGTELRLKEEPPTGAPR